MHPNQSAHLFLERSSLKVRNQLSAVQPRGKLRKQYGERLHLFFFIVQCIQELGYFVKSEGIGWRKRLDKGDSFGAEGRSFQGLDPYADIGRSDFAQLFRSSVFYGYGSHFRLIFPG